MVACAITDAPEGLHAMGVRDSKALSRGAREALEPKLKEGLKGFAIVALEPAEIDRGMGRRSLNEIEGEAFVRAVVEAAAGARAAALLSLQADAADAVESNFRAFLVKGLAQHAATLKIGRFEVEHKADERHPAVSAASILAKVERDRRVKRIANDLGQDIGSGYPSDKVTMGFLREYIRANKQLPSFARRSWKPAKELMREIGADHRTLDHFGEGGDTR